MDPAMLKQVALGVAPPFVAVLAALVGVWRVGRGAGPGLSAWRRTAVPLLMALAYLGTHALIFGAPEWPVRRALNTLLVAAVLAGTVGAIVAARRAPGVVVFALGAVGACIGAWLGARGVMSSWPWERALVYLGLAAVAGGANAAGAEYILARLGGRGGPAAVMIAVGGSAQVLATGFFSLSLGQAAGVGAAMLAGAVVASFAAAGREDWRGVGVVPAVMAVICLFQGVMFAGAERPLLLAGLCAAGLPTAAIVLRSMPREWSGVRRTACVLLGIVLPVGTAVVTGAVAWLEANRGA